MSATAEIDIIAPLYEHACGLLLASEMEPDGTEDKAEMAEDARMMLAACAEIHRLRQDDAFVIVTILANTPVEEWASKKEIASALSKYRKGDA